MNEPNSAKNPSEPQTSLSDAMRQRLLEVRLRLLRLHKVLLDGERHTYEQTNGRTVSGGELLQLLLHDEGFAWLRPISELVVKIDEALEAEEPLTEEGANTLLRQVRLLLIPSEANESFGKRYQVALQQSPDSILAHAEIIRLLPPRPSDD